MKDEMPLASINDMVKLYHSGVPFLAKYHLINGQDFNSTNSGGLSSSTDGRGTKMSRKTGPRSRNDLFFILVIVSSVAEFSWVCS